MKVRFGHVTNSSSSSFVLAFKDQADVGGFKNYCEEWGYEQFYEYVKSWIKPLSDEEKKRIVSEMRNIYEVQQCDREKMVNEYITEEDYPSYREYCIARSELIKTEEFKSKMEAKLQQTDFYKKKKRIWTAEYIIDETIWDTDGGLMEWAIRHGFVEREMHKYCIYSISIG